MFFITTLSIDMGMCDKLFKPVWAAIPVTHSQKHSSLYKVIIKVDSPAEAAIWRMSI